jgi:predicted dehydrogenase
MILRVALIGLGYWGNNLARNIILHPDFELVAVVDSDNLARDKSQLVFNCNFYESIEMLPSNLDIVFVSTRPGSHFELAKGLLKKTKTIVLAKPACSSLSEAEQLLKECLKFNKSANIFVDYTYHFSPLFKKFKTVYLENFEKGEVIEITSYRTSLGIIQSDVSVIADLLSHDLSIFLKMLPSDSLKVQCISSSLTKWGKATSVMANLRWSTGHVLSCHASWISPQKTRKISLIGDSKALIVSELNTSKKLEVINFDSISNQLDTKGKILRNQSFSLGDTFSPEIHDEESIFVELTELANTHKYNNSQDLYSLSDAVTIWKIIEALENSLVDSGREIEVVL